MQSSHIKRRGMNIIKLCNEHMAQSEHHTINITHNYHSLSYNRNIFPVVFVYSQCINCNKVTNHYSQHLLPTDTRTAEDFLVSYFKLSTFLTPHGPRTWLQVICQLFCIFLFSRSAFGCVNISQWFGVRVCGRRLVLSASRM